MEKKKGVYYMLSMWVDWYSRCIGNIIKAIYYSQYAGKWYLSQMWAAKAQAILHSLAQAVNAPKHDTNPKEASKSQTLALLNTAG